MNILKALILTALTVACGSSNQPSPEDCRLSLTLDLNASRIDSNSTSSAIYSAEVPSGCRDLLNSAQGHLEMVESSNANKAFRLNSLTVGDRSFNVSFLNLTRAQVLSGNLFDGFYDADRDVSKTDSRMALEQKLLDSLQLPFFIRSQSRVEVRADVLGQPAATIEITLQSQM